MDRPRKPVSRPGRADFGIQATRKVKEGQDVAFVLDYGREALPVARGGLIVAVGDEWTGCVNAVYLDALRRRLHRRGNTEVAPPGLACGTLVASGVTIVRTCEIVGHRRASDYRKTRDWRVADTAFIDALNEQLQRSPRTRFWKRFDRMRLKGYQFNHKRVHRVYCQMDLT